MKVKYLLVYATGDVIPSTQRYFVWCSNSRQGTRDYLFLVAHCTSMNLYFERMTESVSAFLTRLEGSCAFTTPIQSVDARTLVRAIKAKAALELSEIACHNTHVTRDFLSTNYRLSSRLAARDAEKSPGSVNVKKPKANDNSNYISFQVL